MATIVGLFEHTHEVDRAIDELTKEGFAKNQIGIVARHDTVKQTGLTTVSGAEVSASPARPPAASPGCWSDSAPC